MLSLQTWMVAKLKPGTTRTAAAALLGLFLAIPACSATPSQVNAQDSGEKSQATPDSVTNNLDRIYREYSSERDKPDIEVLVRLDRELRSLFVAAGFALETRRYLKPEYERIGLSPAQFDADYFDYSGKLLAEAHALDPNSRYRSYTLWSTVEARGTIDVTPPAAAESYAREFPSGPFITQAFSKLAGFYDDLYKVIKRAESGNRSDYKYECFKSYLNHSAFRAGTGGAADRYSVLSKARSIAAGG